MTEKEYINQLRLQFVDKINSDWSNKYSQLGESFDSIKNNYGNTSRFLTAVREDIKATIFKNFNLDIDNYPTKKGIKESKMSTATIKKILNSELKSEVSIKIIAQYLDYPNLDGFKKQFIKIREDISQIQPNIQSVNNDIVSDVPLVPSNNGGQFEEFYKKVILYQKAIITMFLIGVIGIIIYLFFPKKTNTPILKNSDVIVVDSLFFKNIVLKADTVEYRAYQKLPIIDTSEVDLYFTMRGSAKATIVQKLVEHHKKNYIITNPKNPSYFHIISCHFIGFDTKKNEAYLETKEKWFLQWYYSKEKKYKVGYNETNHQSYILKYEDGRWKVETNDYDGEPYKMDF